MRLLAAALAGGVAIVAPRAACCEDRAAPSSREDTLAAAKDLFVRGLSLLDAGDVERALDYFLRSRALVPGKGNTANAAYCLERLGRDDEALELYEELVTRFEAELGPHNRARLVPAMTALRSRVGSVAVTANVDGVLVIDGRPRGRLPLPYTVRVLPGHHRARVVKDGYETAERLFTVAAGETANVDVSLRPLAQAGRLRVEDATNEGADVFVDRVRLGAAPWEGTLSPGEHIVWTASGDRGSAPTRAIVVQGQIATIRLSSEKLGPTASIVLEPPSAELSLDGTSVGSGPFSARLPAGAHEISGSEPGYFTKAVRFVEPETGGAPLRVALALAVDPRHPRWPRRALGTIRVEGFAGVAAGRTLAGDAERWCPSPCGRVLGEIVGARAGFRFPWGLSLDLTAGYMSVGEGFTRSRSATFLSGGTRERVTYDLTDDAHVRGPLIGGGAGFAAALRSWLLVVSRVTAGAVFAGATDPITGSAATRVGSVPVIVSGRGERVASAEAFVLPELGLEARRGAAHVGLSLGLASFFGAGPRYGHDLLEVDPATCTAARPGAPACAPASALIASERAFGSFALWMPMLSGGYGF